MVLLALQLLLCGSLSAQVVTGTNPAPPSTLVGSGGSITDQPEQLLVEYQSQPLGIQTRMPRLSWVIRFPGRAQRQTAYRVLVSSSLNLISLGIGDLWDSGKTVSARSTNVPYGGVPLADGREYYWKVMIWDRNDVPGPWSFDQVLGTGIFPGHWTASHIWDGTTEGNNYCYLRTRISISKQIRLAKVYVSAHDDYKLFINGVLVGRGPAQSDPFDRQLYNTYDIAGFLSLGANVIAAVGHYHGAGAGCGVLGTPAFVLQGEIKFTDQSTLPLNTDSTWKVLATTAYDEQAPFRGPAFAMATGVERFVADNEPLGWTLVGFDDSQWNNAVVVTPGYNLESQTVGPQELERVLHPVLVTQPVSGVDLIDFGENISGYIRLVMNDFDQGDVVTVSYSEVLSNGRIVRDRNGITNYYDQYVCSNDPVQIWEPDIKYQGFRYVELEGYWTGFTPDKLTALYVHTKLPRRSHFECSSDLLNRVFEICVQSQKNSAQGVLASGPQREQTQYAVDGVIQGLNIAYNFPDPGLMRKFVYDLWDSNPGAGIIFDKHPSQTGQIVPEWILHWPIALWNQYLFHDDLLLLEEMFPNLQSLIATFEAFRDVGGTNLLSDVPGLSIGDAPDDNIDANGSASTIQNCLYYNALRIAADIAEVLGVPGWPGVYRNAADQIKDGINAHLFNGVDRYIDSLGGTQFHALASVFPLSLGIVSPGNQQAVLNYVKGLGFEPSVYGGYYLIDLLYKFDQGEHVYDLIHQNQTHWGHMLDQGATTTWEAWDAGRSRSHGWSAYPMKFFKSGILGVEPTLPAYEAFRVRPRTGGGLTYAEGSIPTLKGSIFVRWTKTATGVWLLVFAPVNTQAEVHVPIGSLTNPIIKDGQTVIWANGTFTGGTVGVSYVGVDGDYVVFNVLSGRYVLEAIGL